MNLSRSFCWRAVVLAVLLLAVPASWARTFTVMVYNVENLIDADGQAVFEEYKSPKYTRAHALTKLQNISRVVAQLESGHGPDVIMFEEIEVDLTPGRTSPDYDAILQRYAGVKIEEMLGEKFDEAVADLPAEALLAKAFVDRGLTGYHVVAAENISTKESTHPLAQKCVIFTRFPVKAVQAHPTLDARAILEVQVEVDGARLYLFDNHWKSGAGDPVTEKIRVANARTLRTRLDEILKADPNADIIIGGDFNSQYNQSARYGKAMPETGLNSVLRSQGNAQAVRGLEQDLYNLWYELPPNERGSDTFRGEWGTLMQLILSRGLFDFRGVQYVDHSFAVGKFAGVNVDAKGQPRRWSFAGKSGAGFSDHFPIYAKFTTVAGNQPNRYTTVTKPAAEFVETDEPVKVERAKIDLEKIALTVAQLPAGANVRTPAYTGKIFRVEGKVGEGKRLTVEFQGETYDVWSFDEGLRKRLRETYHAGDAIRFYGELGQYKEHWQFVVREESWVK